MRIWMMIFVIALISCNNGEEMSDTPKPKYRTVFFGDATLKAPGVDVPIHVRVMLDTTTMVSYLCSTELWNDLRRKAPSRYGSISASSKIDHIDENDGFRYYTTYDFDYTLYQSAPSLIFANCKYLYQYLGIGHPRRLVDLSQQRRITGQQIDIVIGTYWAKNLDYHLDNPIYEPWKGWANATATTESGEKVNILEYYTDSQIQVPYDWGR